MVRKYLAAFVILIALVAPAAALTFTVNFTGSPTAADVNAAMLIIKAENARRAALTPPLAALPTGTTAEKVASYKTALAQIVDSAHNSYVEQAKTLTHADRKAAYDTCPQSVKDQVDTLLAPYLPQSP